MYKMDDAGFYQDFKNSGITTQNEKNTFVMYHLNGSHGPYVMNENAEAVPENSVGVDSQTKGSFKIITDYIKELKAKGYSVEQGKVPIKFLEEKFCKMEKNF